MVFVVFSLALIILKVMLVFCTMFSALGACLCVCVCVCVCVSISLNDVSGKFSLNFGPSHYLCGFRSDLAPTLMYSVSSVTQIMYHERRLVVSVVKGSGPGGN